MKKVLIILFILLLAFGGYYIYTTKINVGIPKLDVEEEKIDIDKLFIYGTYLNLSGSLVQDKDLKLVLYNGEFMEYPINIKDNYFNLADEINRGLFLEDIPIGKYYLFLRSRQVDENGNDVYKYYVLNNTTSYKETTYYTFSNVGNKILITSDEEYNTLTFDVTKNTDNDIYDVVIDPGHGGKDGGANKGEYKEADFTMKYATDLKQKFEKAGMKVKLTHEDGELPNDEKMPDYGKHGRAVIGHEVNAKFVLSIHLNSNAYSSVHGLELYTPANINYDFAKDVVKNIIYSMDINYSSNRTNKVFDGIYTRKFTEKEIESATEDAKENEKEPYDITTDANYYYMIRETGGIMTGAYVDDRNEPKVPANPYYNSNVGCEAYLFELGYLTNESDLNNIINNMDKYTTAITTSFETIFNKVNS